MATTFEWLVCAVESDLIFTLCSSWQSMQVGAPLTPEASAAPWSEAMNLASSAAWHLEHVESANSFLASAVSAVTFTTACVLWQSEQAAAAPPFNAP
jgi:hypothetical protein